VHPWTGNQITLGGKAGSGLENFSFFVNGNCSGTCLASGTFDFNATPDQTRNFSMLTERFAPSLIGRFRCMERVLTKRFTIRVQPNIDSVRDRRCTFRFHAIQGRPFLRWDYFMWTKMRPVSHTRAAHGSVWDVTRNHINHHRASTHRRSLACMGLERSRVAERNSQGSVRSWAARCLDSSHNLRRTRNLRVSS
jgi:hypothetical protein